MYPNITSQTGNIYKTIGGIRVGGGCCEWRSKIVSPTMDSLPDEVLLHILQYVTPFELWNLACLSSRYEKLILEHSLWTNIDCSGRFASPKQTDFFIEQIHNDTKSFQINLAPSTDNVVEERINLSMLEEKLGYDTLTILALEGVHFDSSAMLFKEYPSSLEEVSFNESTFEDAAIFFRYAGHRLRKLRVITLEHCLSVGSGILSSLANFAQLEIVSLNGCMGVKDSFVTFSMDARLGYPQLRCLDVRCTALGGDLLNAAAKLPHLGELYFHNYFHYVREAPSILEKQMRVEELLKYRRVNMTTKEGIVEAEDSLLVNQYENAFNYTVLAALARSEAAGVLYTPPASVLYKRPYWEECKCKWEELSDDMWLDIVGSANGASGLRKRRHSPNDGAGIEEEDSGERSGNVKEGEVPPMKVMKSELNVPPPSPSTTLGVTNNAAPSVSTLVTSISTLTTVSSVVITPAPSVSGLAPSICTGPVSTPSVSTSAASIPAIDGQSMPSTTSSGQEPKETEKIPAPSPASSRTYLRSSRPSVATLTPPSLNIASPRWDSDPYANCEDAASMTTAFQPYFCLANGREIRGREPKPSAVYQQQAQRVYEISLRGQAQLDAEMADGALALAVIGGRAAIRNINQSFPRQPRRKSPCVLRQLSLRGVQYMHNGGLRALKDLSFDLLDVTGTRVTADGVRLLKQWMPHCRILHESACKCRPR